MEHPNDRFIFSNMEVSRLSISFIARYFSEPFALSQSQYLAWLPEIIEIDSAVFTKTGTDGNDPQVSIIQAGTSLVLGCDCRARKNKLCIHMAAALSCLLSSSELRLFYDPLLRRQRLLSVAKAYGLENENNLDDYFRMTYQHPKLSILPINPGILPYDEQATPITLWTPEDLIPKNLLAQSSTSRRILVICQHKYYQECSLLLLDGEFAKSGKMKNPLKPVDPSLLIWETTDVDSLKFYAALMRFQSNLSRQSTPADFEAMQMVVKNPLDLPIYYHDKNVSEKLNASTLIPIQLDSLVPEITITVFKKHPFYEITGALKIEDIQYPFKELQLQFEYFVKLGQKLWLLPNANILRVLTYFKKNRQIILVHHLKYEAFRKDILAGLEEHLSVNYAYIQPASQQQLVESGLDSRPKSLLYLADSGNYVSITPVMRYGELEIPVYSRKQLFDTDLNGNVFQVERDSALEIRFTTLVMQLHPEFEQQLQETRYFYLHKDKFLDADWFLDAFERLHHAAIEILGFNGLKKNKNNVHKAKINIRVTSGVDWFKTALSVEFGAQKAHLRQIYTAVKDKQKYIHLDDGTLGILPLEWIEKFAAYFKVGEIEAELLKIPKSNFGAIEELFEAELISQEVKTEINMYAKALSSKTAIPAISIPNDLKATLRDYQAEGVFWLNLLDNYNFGGCLADDMGLGKTLQIIAFILTQRAKRTNNTNLIVVPTSLLFNWQAEVQKFAPSLKIWAHYGASRIRRTTQFKDYEIILTTYGTLLSDIQFLKGFHFNYVILDESQAIKNPDSERYFAARLLKCRNRLLLTGTPLENNTFDLFGQFSFACPGLLGNKQSFKDIFAIPIDKFEDRNRARELQKKISPFILRRTKKQVVKELPEKTELVIYCEMGAEQRQIYNNHERQLREYIASKSEDDIPKSSMHVLKGLTNLRQICNAPSLLKDSAFAPGNAAKMDALMAQIAQHANQHKILIFSQFVTMLDLIKAELIQKGISFAYLSGQTKNRSQAVDTFQNDDSVNIFLISLKAGGTGLNLTSADYVYLVDPWWNPAVENQAIDRCYRIGQTKKVMAVRLVCPDTIEDKIQKLQASKTQLANTLVKTDAAYLKNFDKTALLDLLT